MNYKICIAIPVRSASLKEIKPTLDKIVKKRSDFVELRFDYIDNFQSISLDFVKDLLNILNYNVSVILTFRDSSEGGQTKISQKERSKILKIFIKAKPEYIDIEMNMDETILNEIINLALQNEVKLIYSYHNFKNTLSFDESIKLIQNFIKQLNEDLSLDSKITKDNVFKIVFIAQDFEDNLIPLKICKELSKSNQKIISFCMGPLGIFSRLMCILTGSFLTYASLDENTAPGQINIKKMRELFDLLS